MWTLLKVLGVSSIVIVVVSSVGGTAIAQTSPTQSPLIQAPATKDSKAEADRLYKQGAEQVEQGKNNEALQSLQQALMRYQPLNRH